MWIVLPCKWVCIKKYFNHIFVWWSEKNVHIKIPVKKEVVSTITILHPRRKKYNETDKTNFDIRYVYIMLESSVFDLRNDIFIQMYAARLCKNEY